MTLSNNNIIAFDSYNNNKHNNYTKAAHHCLCAHQFYKMADELYQNSNIVQCHDIINKADRHFKIADYFRRRANKYDHIFKPLEIIGISEPNDQIDMI